MKYAFCLPIRSLCLCVWVWSWMYYIKGVGRRNDSRRTLDIIGYIKGTKYIVDGFNVF